MRTLTLFGKVNFVLGIIFFILGIFLFAQRFNGVFVFEEQYLSLSFIFLGISLLFASYLRKNDNR